VSVEKSVSEPWKRVGKTVRARTGQKAGVFADRVWLMRSEGHVLLSFRQVFDIDDNGKALLEQSAADVYMPAEAARHFAQRLLEALNDEGGR